MANKHYIDAQQLLDDSFNLALKVLDDGYQPDLIIAIWRGGTPVGIAVHELFEYVGCHCDHISIRTSLYKGIEKRASNVSVHGLKYVVNNVKATDRLLIVDDVHDTGRSIHQVINDINNECGSGTPDIRIATPYFKPGNNQVGRIPDYYLHETEDWLVFPHELSGLSAQELLDNKPGIAALQHKLQALAKQN
ncbi:MAG: hypoxanthine phosphoribosyltransferase [Oceanicoccus sp.]|uniref:phosphoribosyltransferase n=1 Tax=Oceanicoccus sp. TaxID=2691044 RepID=UPI0026331F84|nr:phosphoribosyltransferase family protein [Oceanicoccus sp.]MCP3907298.1 hypoxanthine phosphoribosyltransferase [Oceanicoccus sp.]MDG1772843.1 phosphoribosyltransferase family protein [Oceanicoccus sp.]